MAMMRLPVALEPVKVMCAMSACSTICWPRLSGPVRMLTTPGGTASWKSWDSMTVERGV